MLALARRRLDEAARALGASLAARAAIEARGATLERYRNEYVGRLAGDGESGAPVERWRALRRFVARLEAAREAHEADLRAAQCRSDEARSAWREDRRRLEALLALERRRAAERALRERRAEQREHDEIARLRRAHGKGEHDA